MEKIYFNGFDFRQTVNEQMPNIENYAKYLAQNNFSHAKEFFDRYTLSGTLSNNGVISIYQLHDHLQKLQKDEKFKHKIAKMQIIGRAYAEQRVYSSEIGMIKFMIEMMSDLKTNFLTKSEFEKVEENFDFFYKNFLKERYLEIAVKEFKRLKERETGEEVELD